MGRGWVQPSPRAIYNVLQGGMLAWYTNFPDNQISLNSCMHAQLSGKNRQHLLNYLWTRPAKILLHLKCILTSTEQVQWLKYRHLHYSSFDVLMLIQLSSYSFYFLICSRLWNRFKNFNGTEILLQVNTNIHI